MLDLALIPPVAGNMIIIGSTVEIVSFIGCYIYFIGMDFVMIALIKFTAEYCKGINGVRKIPAFVYAVVSADIVQIILNIVFGHVFDLECVEVQGFPYYRLVPLLGQSVHRIVDYAIYLTVLLVFVIVSARTAKIYRERYSVLVIALIIIGVWQSFYIFSRTPVDRSMAGFGVFGLLVFYLSIFYRPLRLLDRMLSDIASHMTDALYVYDPVGKCIWANETGLKIFGLEEDDLDEVPGSLNKKFGERPYTTENWSDNVVLGSGDEAEYYTIENHFVSADSKHLAGSYLIVRDNTEEQQRIRREIYNSTHDALTGLYTKQYLFECIRTVLDSNKAVEYAALFVDVKNFKIVNDIFGVEFGDKALKQIADYLRKSMSEGTMYARLGGDTFGLFMPAEEFEKSKDKIEKELLDFVVTDANIEHRLLIHIGVYEIDEADIDVSVMFDRAHLALSSNNGGDESHISYYDKELRKKMLWDQQITGGLSQAIDTMQIRPYLQPIADRTGKVVGAEALARWIHPEKGFMPPGMFIPVLEKNGLIYEVDRHIWRCACKILAQWKKENNDAFISVNISPKDFYYIDIVTEIKNLIKEFNITPEKLRIEITETVMMTDVEEKFKMLEELRQLGFIVEMDDFGSGFSSLNLLKDMPVDVLKIDMKFLESAGNSLKAQTIVRNIIKLSEDLNITSLTEGVETMHQYKALSEMGCKLFQGYYFAKPLPIDDFEKFAFSKAE